MSYDTIKDGISLRLRGLGLQESKEIFDFDSASTNEYNKKFIMNVVSGDNDSENEETNTRYFDSQLWEISIAYEKSARNLTENRDKAQRKREAIIADLDNSTNWTSFVSLLRYESWELEDRESYFVLHLRFRVQDRITYT